MSIKEGERISERKTAMNENEKLLYIRYGIPRDIMNAYGCGMFEDAVSMIDARLGGRSEEHV